MGTVSDCASDDAESDEDGLSYLVVENTQNVYYDPLGKYQSEGGD